MSWRGLCCALLLLGACKSDGGAPRPDQGPTPDSALVPDGGAPADADAAWPAHCNPLTRAHCFLPWPSSFYLAQDATTATGYRLAYRAEALPSNRAAEPFDVEPYNRLDGFPAAAQPVVALSGGVSAAGLPAEDADFARSTDPASLVQIIEWGTGRRVPLFAEPDQRALSPVKSALYAPGLLIHPVERLKFNTRYAVLLRTGIEDGQGQPAAPPEPFRRLRDGAGPGDDATLAAYAPRVAEVLAFVEQQGVPRDQVLLAWDFHTASEQAVTGPLVAMVDEALAGLPAGGPAYTISEQLDHEAAAEPLVLRELRGELEVPSFLATDELKAPLRRDAQGKPQLRGPQRFSFYVQIPRCAATASGPLPLLIFGHGVFGDAQGELTSPYHKQLGNTLCMVQAGTNWVGVSQDDMASVGVVLQNVSHMQLLTDRLHQGHVNFQVFVELMLGKLLQDPVLAVGGKPVADGKEVYYLGISNGGIQATTFAALSKRVGRVVANVPGAWWTMLMQRSSNFIALQYALDTQYPDPVDLVALLHLTQSLWDATDPINFAQYVTATPLPGRSAKRIILQEGLYDDQVPNLTTRALARGLGLPQLAPGVEPVFGLALQDGPLPSAYVQWDLAPPMKPPRGNLPIDSPSENRVHDEVRLQPSCVAQMQTFFRPDGQAVHTCAGPCGKE